MILFFQPSRVAAGKAAAARTAVGALAYGELESMLLPPPIIWKDLGLTNGIDDMDAGGRCPAGERSRRGKLQLDDPLDER